MAFSISIQKISPYLNVIIINVELTRLDANIDNAKIFIQHIDVPNLGAIIIRVDFPQRLNDTSKKLHYLILH